MSHWFLHRFRRRVAWSILFRGWRPLVAAAHAYRRTLGRRTRMVLVTGTYGKTTAIRALRALFGLPLDSWTEINANCRGEVAWTVLREPPWRRHSAVEVGAGRAGHVAVHTRAIDPDIVVVTWIGEEHLTAFGTLERLRSEKADAVRGLSPESYAILNADDPNVRWMATQTRAKIIWFGLGPDAEIRGTNVTLEWPHATRFTLGFGKERMPVRSRLMGERNVYPALAAAAAGFVLGFSAKEIVVALEALPPTPGRLQITTAPGGFQVIVDDYKATPETVHAALDFLGGLPATRRWVVLSHLNNLAPADEPKQYAAIAEKAAMTATDIIIIGDRWSDFLPGFLRSAISAKRIRHLPGVRAATAFLRQELRPGDVILFKSHESRGLARIALALQGRAVRCEVAECLIRQQCCYNCPQLEHPDALSSGR